MCCRGQAGIGISGDGSLGMEMANNSIAMILDGSIAMLKNHEKTSDIILYYIYTHCIYTQNVPLKWAEASSRFMPPHCSSTKTLTRCRQKRVSRFFFAKDVKFVLLPLQARMSPRLLRFLCVYILVGLTFTALASGATERMAYGPHPHGFEGRAPRGVEEVGGLGASTIGRRLSVWHLNWHS